MYQVKLGNNIIYYPGNDDYTIFSTNLNEEVGLAGEFTFKVPPTNPLYGQLSNGALVTVIKDDKEHWRGEIRDIKIDFSKTAEVYCLEDLAWLGDEYLTPVKITDQTYAQRFLAAISAYNANRPAERQFNAGNITNITGSSLCNWTTEYEWSILDSLRNCICKDDGYIKVRRVTAANGTVTRYIDIKRLEDYGVAASQTIEYGYNLLDYVKESDYGNLTNILTPYGDELDDQYEDPIYIYDNYGQRLQGTTISNTESINTYGRHAKAVVFDNVSSLNQLNALAQAYLTRYCQPQLTMEVQAVDLAEVENVDAINIGDSIRVIAKPFAVDQRLYLTQLQQDIQNPDKNTLTLSGKVVRKTLTHQLANVMETVDELPSESSILRAAKTNALNLLLDETQDGYLVYEYDSHNKYIVALNICNAKTLDASTKRWRWSQTGFGYMERANINVDWPSSNIPIAITMKGEIIGDFITAGAITLAGSSENTPSTKTNPAENAFMRVYNGNALIGRWGKDGIWIGDGSIEIGKTNYGTSANPVYQITFKVDKNGNLTARRGYIGNGANGWTIQDQSIYNGCSGVDTDAAGTYVGTDGIRNQLNTGNNKKYTQIKNGKLTTNDVKIEGGELQIGLIDYGSSANPRYRPAFIVDSSGNLTARRGYIGDAANGWTIQDGAIYNGCSGVDTDAVGTYVGKNGIRNQTNTGDNKKYTQIKNGKLTTNDVKIEGGELQIGILDYGSSANPRYRPKFKVDSDGNLTARRGYIGDGSNGWNIKDDAIYNGCNAIDGGGNGTYVGKNGIRNKNGNSHVTITNGKITANDADIKGTVAADNGSIGNFLIDNGTLAVGDAIVSKDKMGCGKAGKGIVNIVGDQSGSDSKYGYIQISNSGSPTSCIDGIRIYGNGIIERYDSSGNRTYRKDIANIPDS